MVIAGLAENELKVPKKRDTGLHFPLSGVFDYRNFFSPQGDFRPGASQPLGHNILVNQDFNFRPQNETAIAIDPNDSQHIVTGYNDYRAGWPVGGGFSTSFD